MCAREKDMVDHENGHLQMSLLLVIAAAAGYLPFLKRFHRVKRSREEHHASVQGVLSGLAFPSLIHLSCHLGSPVMLGLHVLESKNIDSTTSSRLAYAIRCNDHAHPACAGPPNRGAFWERRGPFLDTGSDGSASGFPEG